MAAFIIIIGSLIVLCIFGLISPYLVFTVFFLLYWLPKIIFKPVFNRAFPSILTYSKNNTINNTISLTFDDTPYGKSHNEIIEILNKNNMKATFFVISDYITETNREDLIYAVRSGHQLCNHGKSNSMHAMLSEEQLRIEIEDCESKINSIYLDAGVSIPQKKFYRPGSGFFTKTMITLLEAKEYILTLGSVYPHDPVIQWPYLNYLYLKYHIEQNDIVIMHDRAWTPETLNLLLAYLQTKNLSSVTLNEFVKT